MKSYVSLWVCLMMILASAVVVTAGLTPTATNYCGFSSSTTHRDLVVGGTFTTSIWVNVHQSIDTAAVDNMTFTPGIIDYTSTAAGNLFSPYIITIKPETSGHIDNTIGYAEPLVGASNVPANNTNGTLMTITWTMHTCGRVDFAITDGGEARGGVAVPVTYIPFSIWIQPSGITGFTATKYHSTQINLSWTKQAGDDKTLIRWRSDHYPTSVTDGTSLYNGTGTTTSHSGLSSGDTRYYSAWGWNTTSGYTVNYATASATTNRAPVFGTPSPVNNSINQATHFTWGIPISDPDGDNIAWSIECNNIQSNSGSGVGGTKSLALTGLSYSTNYTIWVNATDGEFPIHAWYRFKTEKKTTPTPGGGAVTQGVGKSAVTISVVHDSLPINATITINRGTLQNIGAIVSVTTTGADGIQEYTLDDGTYVITVTAPGMQTYQQILTVAGTTTKIVTLQASTGLESLFQPPLLYFIIALIVCLLLFFVLAKRKKDKAWYRKL